MRDAGVGRRVTVPGRGRGPVDLVVRASLWFAGTVAPAAGLAVLDTLSEVSVPWPIVAGLALLGAGTGTFVAWHHLRDLPRAPASGLRFTWAAGPPAGGEATDGTPEEAVGEAVPPVEREAGGGHHEQSPGRDDEVGAVVEHLQGATSPVVVVGRRGVGTSTVAEGAARRFVAQGGEVAAGLRVGAPSARRRLRARHVARELGVQYRQLVGRGRLRDILDAHLGPGRMLLVVDGATGAGQVPPRLRDLFPHVVVVTARGSAAIPGSEVVHVPPAGESSLVPLLVRDGDGRERDRAGQLVAMCGRMPGLVDVLVRELRLATPKPGLDTLLDRLRTVVEAPSCGPSLPRDDPAERLRRRLLQEDVSLDAVSRPARRLFRRLPLVDPAIEDEEAVLAVRGRSRGPVARWLLDRRLRELRDAGLVEEGASRRVAESVTGLARLHLASVGVRARRRAVMRIVRARGTDPDALRRRPRAEVAAVRGLFDVAPRASGPWFVLAEALCDRYDRDGDLGGWKAVADRVLARCSRVPLLPGWRRGRRAWAHNQVGVIHRRRGTVPGVTGAVGAEELTAADAAFESAREAGGKRREAQPLTNLGLLRLHQGQTVDALRHLQKARDQRAGPHGAWWWRGRRQRSRYQLALTELALANAYRIHGQDLQAEEDRLRERGDELLRDGDGHAADGPDGGEGAGADPSGDGGGPRALFARADDIRRQVHVLRRSAHYYLTSALAVVGPAVRQGHGNAEDHLAVLANLAVLHEQLGNRGDVDAACRRFREARSHLAPGDLAAVSRVLGPESGWPCAGRSTAQPGAAG